MLSKELSTRDKIKRLKADSKVMMSLLKSESLKSRFLLGSHNGIKLKKSLSTVDRLDLVDRTLLSPDVHKAHAKKLSARFLNRWDKIREKARKDWLKLPKSIRASTVKLSDHEVAANHIRFLTLVDSVTAVDAKAAFRSAIKLKEKLTTTAKSITGLTCLGVIEVEVVSMSLMRELRTLDKTSDSEWRKLDVCETLSKNLKGTLYGEDESLFLVHFHGVVTAKDVKLFESFSEKLKRVKAWTLAPRQIELKSLSSHFGGSPKSIDQSLRHIATYITKGGNDWYSNKAYLRYKIGFENDDDQVNDEMSWVAKNWRRSELLRQEHSEEGITDILSLTVQEIVQLTLVIDSLMGSNRTRTGYLVSVGK
jgi:hypothetical protein